MRFLCIDGNSVINRAYFGVHPLNAKDGTPTNAIFGFLNIMIKLKRELEPDNIVIAFDVSRKTFRNEQYEDYKANRTGMPDDLAIQLPLVKEILTYMGHTVIGCEGYEGDDVLGTLAKMCNANSDECVIATGDRDCLQLIDDNVKVCLLKNKENILYDSEKVFEDFAVTPKQVIELKALMGDSSDNIPGVKGIGEKTAISLISQVKNIDEIYEKIDQIQCTPRVKKLLLEGKDSAFLSRTLATICKEAPINISMDDLIKKPTQSEELTNIMQKLEMFSFLEKLNLVGEVDNQNTIPKTKVSYNLVENAKLDDIKDIVQKEIFVVLKNETLQVCVNNMVYQIEDDVDKVIEFIAKNKIEINTFMAKPLIKKIKSCGFDDVNLVFDAELAGYLLNPSSKGYLLSSLSLNYIADNEPDIAEDFIDTPLIKMLKPRLIEELKSTEMLSLFQDIEMPLCEVLADMEIEGFAIDNAGLKDFGETLQVDLLAITSQIYNIAGEEFNINSTRELGRILFEKLGLPAKKKTKTGYSTDIDVLESIEDKHEIVAYVIEYRKLSKLLSTYVIGLQKVVGEDKRVHSTFNQTETRTGRISSTEPNVQNIPIRTKRGSEMRKFFIARDGYTLVDADYSQIELRILAHIADDKNMIDAFLNGDDIHAITASQVFNCPIEQMTPQIRNRAKAINFGIVYGISAFSLSKDINVTVAQAKQYITAYMESYSGVCRYMEETINQVQKQGYAKTLYGRRRDLSDINSPNKLVKAFAQRVARNMPIQGTAADVIKVAMIKVHERIKKEGLDARLILQVHDELIVEAPTMQADTVKKMLQEEMQNAAQLKVKLLVDVNTGKTWYDAH